MAVQEPAGRSWRGRAQTCGTPGTSWEKTLAHRSSITGYASSQGRAVYVHGLRALPALPCAVYIALGDTEATVQATYSHMMPDDRERARKAMEWFFARPEPSGRAGVGRP